jgi:hypothetical protein
VRGGDDAYCAIRSWLSPDAMALNADCSSAAEGELKNLPASEAQFSMSVRIGPELTLKTMVKIRIS